MRKHATLASGGLISIPYFSRTHLAQKEGYLRLVPPLALLSGRQVHFYLDREPLRHWCAFGSAVID